MLIVGVVTDVRFVVHCIRNTDKQRWEHVTLIHLYWKPRRKWIDKIGEPLAETKGMSALSSYVRKLIWGNSLLSSVLSCGVSNAFSIQYLCKIVWIS